MTSWLADRGDLSRLATRRKTKPNVAEVLFADGGPTQLQQLADGNENDRLAVEQHYAMVSGELEKATELARQMHTQVTCTRCQTTFAQGQRHKCNPPARVVRQLKDAQEREARAAARRRAEVAKCPDCKELMPPAGTGHSCKWVDPLYRTPAADTVATIKRLEAEVEKLKASV